MVICACTSSRHRCDWRRSRTAYADASSQSQDLIGEDVELHSLPRARLNGTAGTVSRHEEVTDRYSVLLANGQRVWVRRHNLRIRRGGWSAWTRQIPLRCPTCIIDGLLPRLADGLLGDTAKTWLREGNAFVTSAAALIGGASPLLQWGFDHLAKHLPPSQRHDVYHVADRLVMSHSIRYSATHDAAGGIAASDGDGRFATSAVSFLTFRDFVAASRQREVAGEGAKPYLGLDVFRRKAKDDTDGAVGPIGESLASELRTLSWSTLDKLAVSNELPVLASAHLFVGSAATLYHCHYDLNPNLHVQLVGRKRFIVFPPEQWPCLKPYGVHHDMDRRAQVDLDAPDGATCPQWHEARGMIVELEPGDALYLPPLWWHHVQTLTTPCVSMAMWFYDIQPQPRDMMPSSGAARALEAATPGFTGGRGVPPNVANRFNGHFFGLSVGGAELSLVRWVEQVVGQNLGTSVSNTSAGAAARAAASGEAFEGAAKERAVACVLEAIGHCIDGRRTSADDVAALPPLSDGMSLQALTQALLEALRSDLGAIDASRWLRSVCSRFVTAS